MSRQTIMGLILGALLFCDGCTRSRTERAPSERDRAVHPQGSAVGAQQARTPRTDLERTESVMLTITSPKFVHNGEIPKRYTSQGADVSPPLAWTGVPPNAKSLALIVDDPDAPDPAAPRRVWVHWVVYNIPPTVTEIAEGPSSLPAGAKTGRNDWNRADYGGPSPPIGRHRYFFKLYALDEELTLAQPTKGQLEQAMRGHILGKAELVGTYQKS